MRDQGRTLKVKDVRQTRPLVETFDGRDLGRLINALDDSEWQDKRDIALALKLGVHRAECQIQ